MGSDSSRNARGRRNVVTIAIANASEQCRGQIMSSLAEMAEPLVEVVDLKRAPEASVGRHLDGVIVALDADRETWEFQLQELNFEGQHPAVIAAIAEHSGDAVRRALRAGAVDVLFLPAQIEDLSRCLIRIGEANKENIGEGAIICALGSVAGGVGVSTLTAALGLASRRITQKRVALLDLGMQSGALAALLDLNPDHTLSELVDPSSTIDSIRLESSLATHSSGLYLLASPKRIEEGEIISADSILAVLEVMRELFDIILIDCGHHMSETLVTVWEKATHLLYPVEQSINSVRPAQRFLDMFERLGLDHLEPQFLINRYVPANPFTVEKIEASLRRSMIARIPRDDEAFVKFQLGAADLHAIAQGSPATLAIDNLARHLSGITVAEAPRRLTLFSRLRTVLKQPVLQASPSSVSGG